MISCISSELRDLVRNDVEQVLWGSVLFSKTH